MSVTQTIIMNENSYDSCKSVLDTLKTLTSDEVILRCTLSGVPNYKESDLRPSMKYSLVDMSHFANKNMTFFTTIPSMTQILLKSTGEEIVEVPMGFVVREVIELLNKEAIPSYTNSELITTHDTRKQAGSKQEVVSNYQHMMSVTRLYHFLVSVGAISVDSSANWTGNERVQGNTIYSNMCFSSYYQYKKMPLKKALVYLESIISGFKEEPTEIEISGIFYSRISIFQTYPMYVPIRASGMFSTPPDDIKRVVYIYDCIASYVTKMNNRTYYKVSYDPRLNGNYNYFISEFRNAGENIQEVPGGAFLRPEFNKFSSFRDFTTTTNGMKVGDKFQAVAKFFQNLGRSIQLNAVGQSSDIVNAVCGTYKDPLIDFYSYRDKQKKSTRMFIDEVMDNSVADDDDEMEERKKVRREIEKRPDFDGYYAIPGEKPYQSKAYMNSAPPAQSSATVRGQGQRNADGQGQRNADGQSRNYNNAQRTDVRGRGQNNSQRTDVRGRGQGYRNADGQNNAQRTDGRGRGQGQRNYNSTQRNADGETRSVPSYAHKPRSYAEKRSSSTNEREQPNRGRGRGWARDHKNE